MAQRDGKGKSGTKGFGSMDEEKKKHMASQGGRASAQSRNTSNRGFASMDKNKQREISSQGGRASQSNRSGRNEEVAELKGIRSESDATLRDLKSLEEEDSFESSKETQGSSSYSETDEDEDEGLGDGNLGRSTRGGRLGK